MEHAESGGDKQCDHRKIMLHKNESNGFKKDLTAELALFDLTPGAQCPQSVLKCCTVVPYCRPRVPHS